MLNMVAQNKRFTTISDITQHPDIHKYVLKSQIP